MTKSGLNRMLKFILKRRVVLARVRVTSMSYELSENKVQLTRIRDENVKFRSVYADCPNSIPYSTF